MKIGIVGAGQVGATAAYSMMMRRVGSGILLVDRNADLAVAQARDILDATPFADPVRVRAGEFADLDGARLVVLAAGTNQKPGESRLDLLSRNAEIFSEIVPAVMAAAPDPIFLVATNPVDVMTQIATAIAGRRGVASERVIGSGTILDSARFRTLLAAHLGISPTYRWLKSPARWGGNLPTPIDAALMPPCAAPLMRSSREKEQPGSGSAPVSPASRRLLRTTSGRCSPAPC
jgi:L-lactate dehydrogenase